MIGRCQRLDPGSIPGRRTLFWADFFFLFSKLPRTEMSPNTSKGARFFWGFKKKYVPKYVKNSDAGNRTRVTCVTGRYTEPLYYIGIRWSRYTCFVKRKNAMLSALCSHLPICAICLSAYLHDHFVCCSCHLTKNIDVRTSKPSSVQSSFQDPGPPTTLGG